VASPVKSIKDPTTAADRAAQARAPQIVQLAAHLPWRIKKAIYSNHTAWRIFTALARRTGWNEGALGWYHSPNGPFAGIALYAKHTNELWLPLGVYEPEFSQMFAEVMRVFRKNVSAPVIWDVGSFEGYEALLAAQHGAGVVLAFEPNADNRRRFIRNVEQNEPLAERIRICPLALSIMSGKVELRSDCEMTQIVEEGVQMWTHRATQRVDVVECRAADDYVAAGAPAPDVIKLDVEGAETLVLKGARGILRNKRPLILLEVHNRTAAADCFALLKEADYDVLRSSHGKFQPAEIIDYGHVLATPREKTASVTSVLGV
jgi:FkbM family methyltransferase